MANTRSTRSSTRRTKQHSKQQDQQQQQQQQQLNQQLKQLYHQPPKLSSKENHNPTNQSARAVVTPTRVSVRVTRRTRALSQTNTSNFNSSSSSSVVAVTPSPGTAIITNSTDCMSPMAIMMAPEISKTTQSDLAKNALTMDADDMKQEQEQGQNNDNDNENDNTATNDSEGRDASSEDNDEPSHDDQQPSQVQQNEEPMTESQLAAQAARRAAWPLTNITELGPNDCLFGRGGGTNHHPGNKRYRKMVDDKKEIYLNSKRLDKPLVALKIIEEWRGLDPPGRFLKQNERTKLWDDVGDKKAREKTSQALREKRAPEGEMGKEGEDGGGSYSGSSGQWGVDQETRFAVGSSSPVKSGGGSLVRRAVLARDHSLGTEVLDGKDVSLEGFSWDETDAAIINQHEDAGGDIATGSPTGPPPSSGSGAPYHRSPSHTTSSMGPPHHYVRENSLSHNPLSDASVSHPAHNPFGDPAYGPPPPHSPHHPVPHHHHHHPHHHPHHRHPHYQSHHHVPERRREHSLAMNPLRGASTKQPAHNTFAEDERSMSWGRSYSYDDHDPPPPPLPQPHPAPPPPPHGYYAYPPPPAAYYGSPPPQYHPPPSSAVRPNPHYLTHTPNRSAFARTDSEARSIQSYGSHDSMYDRRVSGASHSSPQHQHPHHHQESSTTWSSQDFSKIATLMSDDADSPTNRDDTIERSKSWGGSSNKLLRESSSASVGTYPPYDIPHTDSEESGKETNANDRTIYRSKSLPHAGSATEENVDGTPFPSPPKNSHTRKKPIAADGSNAASSTKDVRKPSLLRKLSGGGLHLNNNPTAIAPNGIRRPEPVKRDTSNQPESMETKPRSIKRAVLSRDASAVARTLKEEQKIREERVSESASEDDNSYEEYMGAGDGDDDDSGVRTSSKLLQAPLMKKLSVDLNKMGLGEKPSFLNRMTTEDVLKEVFDSDELDDPLVDPEPLSAIDRVTTIDSIAMDIANGRPGSGFDDTFDLNMFENDQAVESSVGEAPSAVNEDVAEKWLSGSM